MSKPLIEHPWRVVTAALLAGAWLGSSGSRDGAGEAIEAEPEHQRGMINRAVRAIASTLGSVAIGAIREVAWRRASAVARQWSDRALTRQHDDLAWRPSA